MDLSFASITFYLELWVFLYTSIIAQGSRDIKTNHLLYRLFVFIMIKFLLFLYPLFKEGGKKKGGKSLKWSYREKTELFQIKDQPPSTHNLETLCCLVVGKASPTNGSKGMTSLVSCAHFKKSFDSYKRFDWTYLSRLSGEDIDTSKRQRGIFLSIQVTLGQWPLNLGRRSCVLSSTVPYQLPE